MSVLEHLNPKSVFSIFEQMCAIPHGSGNTKAISDFCVAFAKSHGLAVRQDTHNNVIIWKNASPGYEGHPGVILQGHLDMVCAKAPDCPIDMAKEGLQLEVTEDGWVTARGTTLGGDDGIAVAMGLAVLGDDNLVHPPLEAVFTVDEEIGLLGAADLDCSDLKGRLLLNIDSEEEGILTVGCAGGSRCDMLLPLTRQETEGVLCTASLENFTGGHSGIEINKGRANTNQLMGVFLRHLSKELPLCLTKLEGGKFDNAITNHTTAAFLLPADLAEKAREMADAWWKETQPTLASDPNGKLTFSVGETQHAPALSQEDSSRILRLLEQLPNGVQAMSKEIPDVVETSANIGILHLRENEFLATISVRSSVNQVWQKMLEDLKATAAAAGASSQVYGSYPAWEYKQDSTLRPLMASLYRELIGRDPRIETTHGGLECGLFSDKIPGLDSVSFGPDIQEVHTPREKMSVASVQRTWEFLLKILERL